MKVSDKLRQAADSKRPYFSMEYFPPKTEQGLANLYDRIERMSRLGPMFVAVTWGAGGATAQRTLELCGACQGIFGIETVMHLTCTNMDKAKVDEALEGAKDAGIQNILALRGDPPRGSEYWTACEGGFEHAVDLVRYIREKYGNYFSIGVAGYPEGHIENQNKEQDFEYFVEKVEAGADFIVSQLVYDAETFVSWERKCRARGIEVPIVAGVLPIQSYQSFRRLAFLTKVRVPEDLRQKLEAAKTNDQAVKDLGVEHAVATVRRLQEAGIMGVHLTTLNLEHSVQRVLAALEMVESHEAPPGSSVALAGTSALPGPSAIQGVERQLWDDFPNGRWGDARSPAFGNADAYGAMLKFDAQGASRVWGHPQTQSDISQLFVRFVRGEIPSLPWSDEPLMGETERIREELVRLNELGYWTLASQPALDGVSSSDETHGWGPRGGYVYQKAFVECFVPGTLFPAFLSRLQSASERITFYAANRQGDFMTNAQQSDGTALTWGVFPGRAVVQPTLIDKMSFLAWRAEAFQTWRDWAAMFPLESDESRFLLGTANDCWLVNVIDNDYKISDAIWRVFH
ncbi:methylenetetrahydrofolate reductase (NAD(P)H) met13 [Coemansia sp. RSA 989]|nr:methylenetetrahydrofolate reductase-domain-containing protein [Coemansia mojavensis]KAJ1744247.1 methylenetetrahydrofolate reductase (NAD(P)H) met13 [Coemansia sp. RSA 1086]KAJ1753225.1 methylenetetrahydrofolate reductase (NAD(P)H) met13 [Coemansia sp. RSA 1821]KAJ1868159.1 methylenetetrahydrofolate reductase (NAD(P)H) met13 [Coemansia sp. RSA 989]KAJ1872346.1 methylenetetrahydrofolate reductase (NAD(P)H) met13 [Coemansia sp. RSA 990]KAJ2653470.1 methylenetetrahydrofolate reductase (NAD(P)H